ncbi:MAG: response regulator transcription factor [Bacteroidetes bacterium]|nr:response regulator transcription factor [Bacteroidota bacterium]
MNPKILIVDDEPDTLEFLGYNLRKEGFRVVTASDGASALEMAKKEFPQLVLLDIMMPGMDGIETCRELRKNEKLKGVMVIFLTARNEDYSQIAGFDAGADDYIAKPVRPSVLVSRVKAVLRRSAGIQEPRISIPGGIVMDREKFLVEKNGESIILTRKEFELLALLGSRPGKVFRREEILERVWGNDVIVGDRTIDVHIRKLREKFGDGCIVTVKGIGYRFRE